VTRNGQVTLPTELRHRWGAGSVLVIDHDDYPIVRPTRWPHSTGCTRARDPAARMRGRVSARRRRRRRRGAGP